MKIDKDNEVRIKEVENGFIIQFVTWDNLAEEGEKLYKKEEHLVVYDNNSSIEASEANALQELFQNLTYSLGFEDYNVKIIKSKDDDDIEYGIVRDDLKKGDQVEIINNEIYKAIKEEFED